jgi:NADPH:quinone reductase
MTTTNTTKVIQFDKYGPADVLKLEEIPLAAPGRDEVRIRIEAMALNRADALFRENTYFIEPVLPASRIGTDAAGVVEAVGENVTDLKPGDRVVTGIGFDVSRYGTHGETAVLPAQFVHRYPDFISPTDATAITVAYLTPWGALVEYGGMKAGDFVVITAASGGVGTAAIQVAKAVGAIPIAVTRGAAKKPELLELGAAHVVVTDEEDLAERVQEITGGRGAQFIFDPIVEGLLEAFSAAAAEDAKIFLYGSLGQKGTLGASPAEIPLMPLFGKEIAFRGYNNYRLHAAPERLARGFEFVFDRFETGALKPVTAKTFPLENYADAHRYLESNTQVGRVVITV